MTTMIMIVVGRVSVFGGVVEGFRGSVFGYMVGMYYAFMPLLSASEQREQDSRTQQDTEMRCVSISILEQDQ